MRAGTALAFLAAAIAVPGCSDGMDPAPAVPLLAPGDWTLRVVQHHGNTGDLTRRWFIDSSGYLDFTWPDYFGDEAAQRVCAGQIDAATIVELTDRMNELGLIGLADIEPPGDDFSRTSYWVAAYRGAAAGHSYGVSDYTGLLRPFGDRLLEIAEAETTCTDFE